MESVTLIGYWKLLRETKKVFERRLFWFDSLRLELIFPSWTRNHTSGSRKGKQSFKTVEFHRFMPVKSFLG